MLFNSFEFLIFFPTVCAIYFALKHQRSRLWFLLIASCFFYGFFIPAYLLILFLVIGIDFYAGQKIEGTQSIRTKKRFLLLSLAANISILAFFKYSNFLIGNWNQIAELLHWKYSLNALKIVLPIGLSFHTFQSMAYVLEVYHGRFKPERDLLAYSVYVLYFPQLVAGPIERPQNILPQLHQRHDFEEHRTVTGLYLIAQGLFKKSVVADSLAPLVGQVFNNTSKFGCIAVLLAVVAFSFQIYCDFSGYSDIARGTSRILGIELMKNFNKPYFAASVGEFWRRWHISLSTWFRDYVFIPLGGSRGTKIRSCFNLLVVFTISGLWHGANWTFVIWGALHGAYLILENLILKPLGLERLPKWAGRVYVFVLVASAWVLFRASSLAGAEDIFSGLFRNPFLGWQAIAAFRIQECLLVVFALIFFEVLDEHRHFWAWVAELKVGPRWALYFGMVWTFLTLGQFSGTQFIYFQF
jgi:D-alanyl-lipoteichoic acid acyltransferase DltB (MBOAT superfamily)